MDGWMKKRGNYQRNTDANKDTIQGVPKTPNAKYKANTNQNPG